MIPWDEARKLLQERLDRVSPEWWQGAGHWAGVLLDQLTERRRGSSVGVEWEIWSVEAVTRAPDPDPDPDVDPYEYLKDPVDWDDELVSGWVSTCGLFVIRGWCDFSTRLEVPSSPPDRYQLSWHGEDSAQGVLGNYPSLAEAQGRAQKIVDMVWESLDGRESPTRWERMLKGVC